MRKLTTSLLPIALILVAIAATACGDSADTALATEVPLRTEAEILDVVETVEVVTEKVEETFEIEPETAVEQTPAEETRSGGIFRRIWSDPPTLDPALVTDTTSAGLVVEIFSGLVSINTNLQLIPDLAQSWEISEDGLVYTFRLRPDAKFHDGKPVTAHDFKWSMERAANPKTASPVAQTYLGDIVGVDDVVDGLTTDIRGVRVIDDLTLQITIDSPKAYFLAKLTYPTAYVLDRENVEAGGETWADSPNGTGPFRLKEYRIGERIILERNDLFYREPASVDAIINNLAGGQSMAMYENDELDITGVGLFDLDRVLDPNEPLNKELVVAPPSFSISYIGFNTSWAPFDDPKFRQALTHVIDKELISREVLADLVVPAYGILPPGLPGYNPNLVGLRFDADLARRLLAESRYADPDTRPPIKITVPGTGGTIGLDLEVILEMWRQFLGVEVAIEQVEWATYLEDLHKREFQAFAGLGWEADYPDPQDFLDVLFHTDSQLNNGGYSNPEVDRLLVQARTEQDVQRRIALYHEVEQLIVDDAAWIPLWFTGERHVLIKSHISGYKPTPMIIPKLKQIKIG